MEGIPILLFISFEPRSQTIFLFFSLLSLFSRIFEPEFIFLFPLVLVQLFINFFCFFFCFVLVVSCRTMLYQGLSSVDDYKETLNPQCDIEWGGVRKSTRVISNHKNKNKYKYMHSLLFLFFFSFFFFLFFSFTFFFFFFFLVFFIYSLTSINLSYIENKRSN